MAPPIVTGTAPLVPSVNPDLDRTIRAAQVVIQRMEALLDNFQTGPPSGAQVAPVIAYGAQTAMHQVHHCQVTRTTALTMPYCTPRNLKRKSQARHSLPKNQHRSRHQHQHQHQHQDPFHFVSWSQQQLYLNQTLADIFRKVPHPSPSHFQMHLENEEDRLYDRAVVHPLLALFAERTLRHRSELYLRRFITKLERGEVPSLLLNVILANAALLSDYQVAGFDSADATSRAYGLRAEQEVASNLDDLTIDQAFAILLMGILMISGNNIAKLQAFIAIAVRFVIAQGWHQLDDPAAQQHHPKGNSPGPNGGGQADDELMQEFRRRVTWMAIYADGFSSAMQNFSPTLDFDLIRLQPNDDALMDRVLNLDPNNDIYPCLAAPLGEFFAGYKEVIPFIRYLYQTCQLRQQLVTEGHPRVPGTTATNPSSSDRPPVTLTDFAQLNATVRHWYAHIPPAFGILPVDQRLIQVRYSPAHYVCLMSFHGHVHCVLMLLNSARPVPEKSNLPPAPTGPTPTTVAMSDRLTYPKPVDPSADPTCARYALESADFTCQVIPKLFEPIPIRFHSSCIYIFYFYAGMTFASHYRRAVLARMAFNDTRGFSGSSTKFETPPTYSATSGTTSGSTPWTMPTPELLRRKALLTLEQLRLYEPYNEFVAHFCRIIESLIGEPNGYRDGAGLTEVSDTDSDNVGLAKALIQPHSTS